MLETAAAGADQGSVGPTLVGEAPGIGPLERIDRLLLVADSEDGAILGPCAGAGEELRRQGAHDVPLVGGGVLRLVDQHVVDAAVELVEHPGRIGPLGQKLVGSLNQVCEIEPAHGVLGALVKADVGPGQVQHRQAVFGDPRGADPAAGVAQALLLSRQLGQDPGVHRLGPELRLGLSGLGAEHLP